MDSKDQAGTPPQGADHAAKVQALRDMVMNAERTIQGAKAMLLQLEGKKRSGRPRKSEIDDAEGTVVQGTFDGQSMHGTDGRQYPVPANYASKSKLVEGDMLKLTITSDGSFIYKQVGPAERKHVIGIVTQNERGSFLIAAEGRLYRVLLASVTYFKLEPGDEVAILLPRDLTATFAAVEQVLQKGALVGQEALDIARETVSAGEARMEDWKADLGRKPDTEEPSIPVRSEEATEENPEQPSSETVDVLAEWIRDMEALEHELKEEKKSEETRTEA